MKYTLLKRLTVIIIFPVHEASALLVCEYSGTFLFCSRFGKTALHFAVTNNTTDCLKLLLEYGADVHSVEELGRTPLWVAASEDGHLDAIVCLLEAGADVNMTDRREKRTPLHVIK